MNQAASNLIQGVEIKELVTHPDERGFFREMIRVTDSFFGEKACSRWVRPEKGVPHPRGSAACDVRQRRDGLLLTTPRTTEAALGDRGGDGAAGSAGVDIRIGHHRIQI
jgi:hypothetical protein